MFTHFLITRFNIKISGTGPERMSTPVLTDEWLHQRLYFFKSFCAPSVLAQTNKNFLWLIYFDSETPRYFIDELEKILSPTLLIKIIPVGHFDLMIRDIQSRIKDSRENYVISSRLDNDDVISNHFIQSVQDAFVPFDQSIINFNAGFEYSLHDHVLKKWNTRLNNQFISIIENPRAESILTIYGFPHWKLPTKGKIINIPGQARWLYLRHAFNYSQQAIVGIPVFNTRSLSFFSGVVAEIKISFIHTCLYSIKWFPVMLRSRLKRLFR